MRVTELPEKTSLTPSTIVKADKRIPRPSNCFIAYRMAIREKVIAGNSKMNGKEISQLAGKMWRSEPEYVKDHFRAIAEKLKAEHTSKYPNYSYSPRKRRNSSLYDSSSSCEEPYNDSILNNKKLRGSDISVNLEENTPSKDEDALCDEIITPKSEPREADCHTSKSIFQDSHRDQYELHDADAITLNPWETEVNKENDTYALIANEIEYVEDGRILTSSCDYGLPEVVSSLYRTARNLAISKDSDPLQYSPYVYTPGYESLYSYYVFES